MTNIKGFEPKFFGMKKQDIYRLVCGENHIEGYDKDDNLVYKEYKNGGWHKWVYNEKGQEIYYENSNGEIVKYIYNGGLEISLYTNSDNEWQIKFYKKGEMLSGCGNEVFKISHYGIYEVRDFETFKNLGDGFFINKKEV